MRIRIKSKLAAVIFVFLLTVSAFALTITPTLAAGPTLCANWSDLQAALTNPATTYIQLTADITIGAGCQINTAMADGLVIDGKDPVTGQIHTITEIASSAQNGNLYINSNTGTLKNITIQNLSINGKDYYGFPSVYDVAQGFNLNYINVNYTGPQMNYNRYGSVRYNNCNITLTQNGAPNTPEECGEVAKVIFEGNTIINSASTGNPIFNMSLNYNGTAPGNVEIKPGAAVSITASTTFIGTPVANTNLLVDDGATLNFTGNTTTADLVRTSGNIVVGDNAGLAVIVNTPGGTGNYSGNAIYANGSAGLTVGSNSTVSATVNGNPTNLAADSGVIGGGGSGGFHINGPNSNFLITVNGNLNGYGFHTQSGPIYIGPSCTMSCTVTGNTTQYMMYYWNNFEAAENAQIIFTPKGPNTNWIVYQYPGTNYSFKLGQGASFLINAPTSGTSTYGGIYLTNNTNIQMADNSSLKVYTNGMNSVDATNSNLINLQTGSITTGQNCTVEAKSIGANTAIYSGIHTNGLNLGSGSTVNAELNATTSTYGIYSNGAVTVGQNANMYIHTASNVTTRQYLLNMASGAFTVNRGATVNIIAEDQVTNATYAAVYANASGMTFNSPKSVVLYNNAGKSLVRYSAAGPLNINNVQQINEWNTGVGYLPAIKAGTGRFTTLPTYNWRNTANPNGGIAGAAMVTGTIAASSGYFSSLTTNTANTPDLATDTGTAAPTYGTAGTFNMSAGKAAAVSFGYLPLTAEYNCIVNPTSVSGVTDPGSAVVLAKWDGAKYVQVGNVATADASGHYAIDVQTLANIVPNVDYAVITSNPNTYLSTEIVTQFHLITFDPNGGRNSPSLPYPFYVLEDSAIPVPPNPANGLKSFGGWYADSGLTQAFDFGNTPIMQDTTLYAKWTFATVIIHETVLGPSGGAATDDDYALANLDKTKNQAFHLIFTDMKTGATYNVVAYRDQPVTLDCLPIGDTLTVQAVMPQHYAASSVALVSSTNGAGFTTVTSSAGTINLTDESVLELNFISKIAPAGFGNAQDASNLYQIASAN